MTNNDIFITQTVDIGQQPECIGDEIDTVITNFAVLRKSMALKN